MTGADAGPGQSRQPRSIRRRASGVDVSHSGADGHLPLGVAFLLAAVLGVLFAVIAAHRAQDAATEHGAPKSPDRTPRAVPHSHDGVVGTIRPVRQAADHKAGRVAMARALVTDAKLLLLDKPLAALDVSTKTDVRRLLRATLRQSSAANILVAHDLLDAVALGDRMIVIENGGVVQTGTPAEVTARPRSRYVADLTGVNLLRGMARGTAVDLDGGGQLTCAGLVTGPVVAVIAPAAVAVHRQRPEGTAGNLWRGTVSEVDLMGDRVRVRVDGTPTITAEVPPSAVDELKLDDGGELWASVRPAAITVYPP